MNIRGRRQRGFTLIELLIVIAILSILMGLLLPTIGVAMLQVRGQKTRAMIREMSVALEAFKSDFNVYPPSRPRVPVNPASPKTDPDSGELTTGAANLVYYLCGPAKNGWGSSAAGLVPFPAVLSTRGYGPHYQTDDSLVRYEIVSGNGVPSGFLDGFAPQGRILYFRFNSSPLACANPADPTDPRDTFRNYSYITTDNDPPGPPTGPDNNVLTGGKFNYPSLLNLRSVASVPVIASWGATRKWQITTYLLVSPGPDGHYGYTRSKKDTGEIVPSMDPDNEQEDSTYTLPTQPDDITNFKN
jgi:general secretion pathway protein G